jgi:hypothetical protein
VAGMTRAAITGFASFLRFWRIIFVLTKHETDSKKHQSSLYMKKSLFKQHAVLACMAISVALIVLASQLYPGGSLLDKHAAGFDWSKNFISNLFAPQAINGWPIADGFGRAWRSNLLDMAFFHPDGKENTLKTGV